MEFHIRCKSDIEGPMGNHTKDKMAFRNYGVLQTEVVIQGSNSPFERKVEI